MLLRGSESSAPFHTFEQCRARDNAARKCLICGELFGGPDRDRTDDLFHAMESQTANNRRHSTYESAQPAKPAQSALFAGKMRATLQRVASGLIVWDQPDSSSPGTTQLPCKRRPGILKTPYRTLEPLSSIDE